MFVEEFVMNLPRTPGFLICYKNILRIFSGEELKHCLSFLKNTS
jgi:hypothetical protein